MPSHIHQAMLDATSLRIGIVQSRFNEFITEALTRGALSALEKNGCPPENIRIVKVPGAWELAVAARALAPNCDAIVAIGAVIRGDTPHFEYVAGAATDGLNRVSLDTGVPISFGVLTTDSMQQAMERAGQPGSTMGNKGVDAAEAAIEMANLLRELKGLR